MRGVIYCACGDEDQIRKLFLSITSLRRFFDGPVKVLTDLDRDYFETFADFNIDVEVKQINMVSPYASRLIKTQVGLFSNFSESLFIDTDTVILKPIDDIWEITDGIAMAIEQETIAAAIQRVKTPRLMRDVATVTNLCELEQPYFNSGVIVWKDSEETRFFFRTWFSEWLLFQSEDQWPLVRTITKTGIKPDILDRKYNCLGRISEKDTVILHGYDNNYDAVYNKHKHLIKKPSN